MIFPTDFYVLDMEDETSRQGSTLILGRPFLMTVRTKIDVHVGTLSMEFGDTLVQFNIFEAMKHLTEDHSLFSIDLIDELIEEYFQLDSNNEDIDNFAEKTESIGCLGSILEEEVDYAESREVHILSDSMDNNNDIADLDLEQLPIITANNLHLEHEDKLLQVLRQHKKAIGWKLSNLPGINPSICMHRILMEEVAKPIRQQ
ncbi:hypothetical protein CR513_09937, partial [Mucuna pruriens]